MRSPSRTPSLAHFAVLGIVFLLRTTKCQIVNRPPHFLPGSGDMARFSLSENTPVGSPVYQLKGIDPEGGKLRYSISGPIFSVDRETGVVRLRQELDRESQDLVEVIISLTDEGVLDTEPNTISLRREIPIRDYNDNSPTFIGRPYTAKISESSSIGTAVHVTPDIRVVDHDEGTNAEIAISCFDSGSVESDICQTFFVSTEKINDGNYTVNVVLLKQLDFESRSSYVLTLMARDGAQINTLSSFATVAIEVIDVQDQPPIFMNTPYSATIEENTPKDTSILTVISADGDTGNPHPLLLTLENEEMGHFKLQSLDEQFGGKAILYTTDIPLDRESKHILQNGGVYTFNIRATEMINKEVPADSSVTQVTIIVTDIDDHYPEFNAPEYNISLPENLGKSMPLPGLSIFVHDKDQGPNSRYELSLKNVYNSEGTFSVNPVRGEERTPVLVQVLNSAKLDYDVEDSALRLLIFDLIASVRGKVVASARVRISLVDVNDNSPVFEKPSYRFEVNENEGPGFKIANISATDRDSGIFGEIRYILKGFGSDKFYTNSKSGGLYVKKILDYEKQTSYSLTMVAVDGGNQETNINVLVDVADLNDNFPMFESLEYSRTIREGAIEFEPQFYVRAIDADGPSQGGNNLTYAIDSDNSISGNVFSIDQTSGEIRLRRAAKSLDTEKGQYELIVSATDYGTPPLRNITRVLVRVGIPGNQRPIFKGHFRNLENLPVLGPPSYRVSVPENVEPGYNVTTVSATDPDGLDKLLRYRIVGANDNFVINPKTGLIQVSTNAHLDRDTNTDNFEIIVNAVDAGYPIPETATTTVYVTIKDVNDKSPKFDQSNYMAYVSERTEPGSEVIKVTATDTDINAMLEYKIKTPIKATSKTGVRIVPGNGYDVRNAFRIDSHSGRIFVNGFLSHDLAAVIILTIEVRDLNAEINKEKQFATTEVTIYVQSFKDINPVFSNSGWKSLKPEIKLKIKEEMPIGSVLIILSAEDPLYNIPIGSYQLISPKKDSYFELNERTGEILLKQRLDYENLETNTFELHIKANSIDVQRSTITIVTITVENVNDNDPEFEKRMYKATIVENSRYPQKIIHAKATDRDGVLTELDKKIGYSNIVYSLHGENAGLFQIDRMTGEILIAPSQKLDYEKTPIIELKIKAEDTPDTPTESRQTTADLVIEVLDVNDNAPEFSQKNYSTVIPENVPIDTFVVKISATDPDEGPGGEVRFEFTNEGEVNGLFKINSTTGEVKTKSPLTGKGRSEPYQVIIRAQDNGAQVSKQESLHSDVILLLFIGDVSANDGIPYFVFPKIGQIANISEDASLGSPVFQVVASDPDSTSTPSGILTYKIQEGTTDSHAFRIDSITGLITTSIPLDRETKDIYNVILEVTDNGEPQQSATSILKIQVLDVDDHSPRFIREIDSEPLEMLILEEVPINTVVGNISAVDEDIDEHGQIDYVFIDGNQEGVFNIARMEDNSAIITTKKRIDREVADSYQLTIKCIKLKTNLASLPRNEYNQYDLSEIQVIIRVQDIDDHFPQFLKSDPTIGVRINIPIETTIITISATDKDPEALPIFYCIENITFVPQFYKRSNISVGSFKSLFILDNSTGELKTGGSLADYVDGYFHVIISANNSENRRRHAKNALKVFIIRDKSLLRFVFARPPTETQAIISEFQRNIEQKLRPLDLELHVFDTQVLTKTDHSLDFSATSSCFQLFKNGTALPLLEMQRLMGSDALKEKLFDTYVEYGVSQVELCSARKMLEAVNLMSSAGTWLVILAALIGIAALSATCTAFCLAKKFKTHLKRALANRMPSEPPFGSSPPVLYSEPIYGPL